MNLTNKILLEQSDWVLVAPNSIKKFSHCKTKQVDGKFYYSPSSCKAKPKPSPKPVTPKPKDDSKETEKNDITGCEWLYSNNPL
jgi:hypothetical protein